MDLCLAIHWPLSSWSRRTIGHEFQLPSERRWCIGIALAFHGNQISRFAQFYCVRGVAVYRFYAFASLCRLFSHSSASWHGRARVPINASVRQLVSEGGENNSFRCTFHKWVERLLFLHSRHRYCCETKWDSLPVTCPNFNIHFSFFCCSPLLRTRETYTNAMTKSIVQTQTPWATATATTAPNTTTIREIKGNH